MSKRIPEPERGLLTAVLAALDVPAAAGEDAGRALMAHRVLHVTSALQIALRENDAAWAARYLSALPRTPDHQREES